MKPSFILSAVNGVVMFVGVVLVAHYIFNNYQGMSTLELGKIVLLASVAVGIHGLMHFWAEVYYGFNPLESQPQTFPYVQEQMTAPVQVVQTPPPVQQVVQQVPRQPMGPVMQPVMEYPVAYSA